MVDYTEIKRVVTEGILIAVPIFSLALFLLAGVPSLVSASFALCLMASFAWIWFIYNTFHSNNVFGVGSTAIIATVLVVSVIMIGYSGFSDTGYTVVSNGKDASLVFVVDGEFIPSQQELYIGDIATDDAPTHGLSVTINGVFYAYNKTLQDKGVRRPIQSLKQGKNSIEIEGSGAPSFARVSYMPEYKPVIGRIQIPAASVGRPAELFVYAEDENAKYAKYDNYDTFGGQSSGMSVHAEQIKTNVRIVDYRNETVIDMTFNGSKTIITIDEIGNYGIYARVFDGVGFSDTYYAEFTVFEGVPYTIDLVPISTAPIQHPFSDTLLPVVFTGDDNDVVKFTKKCINGYYAYSKYLGNWLS